MKENKEILIYKKIIKRFLRRDEEICVYVDWKNETWKVIENKI
jgi:hypothetical protein